MAKIVLEEQQEFLVFPIDSILDLKVEECTTKTVQGQRGEWTKVEFKFKILGVQAVGDGSPTSNYDSMVTEVIYGSVPFKLTDSPENKLRQWAEALFGMELGLGFELDTDMFVGRVCRGLTSQYDARAKDPATGLPFKRHQVESLLPKAGGTAAPQQQAQPQQGWGGQQPPAPQQQAAPTQDPWSGVSQQQGWGGGNDEPPF